MNKEFRVWDGIRFLWPSEFCLFPEDDGIFSPRRLAGYGELRDIPNSVIQQYTGLTDSTGKKIFEGDIVVESDTKYNDLPYEIKYCRHSYSQILAFHPVSKNNDHLNYYYGEWYGKQVTVIGNIFETPELLKP